MGYVKDAQVSLTIKVLGTNQVIQGVGWKDFTVATPLNEGVICLFKDMVGRIDEVRHCIILEAPDGSQIEVGDIDFADILENDLGQRDPDGPFDSASYIGQTIMAKKKCLRYVKWVKQSKMCKSFMESRNSFSVKAIPFTVKDVQVDGIDIRWMFGAGVEGSVVPPKLCKADFKDIRVIDAFSRCNLQTGDRGYYILKESDIPLMSYEEWEYNVGDESDTPSDIESSCSSKQKLHSPKATEDAGTSRRRRKISVSVKRIRDRILRPAKRSAITSKLSSTVPLIPGSKVAAEIIATETSTTVMWQDGSIEENIPSNLLYPVQHVDSHEFFPGDFVVENKDDFIFTFYGVIQTVNHSARTAVVKWMTFDGANTTVKSEESVSVYDLKDHPDFQFRPGTCVLRFDGLKDPAKNVGQVINILTSGELECRWADRSTEIVPPLKLMIIGDYDEDDLWADDSESGDDYASDDSEYETADESPSLTTDGSTTDLDQLLSAVNRLEEWMARNTTINNRNQSEVLRLLIAFLIRFGVARGDSRVGSTLEDIQNDIVNLTVDVRELRPTASASYSSNLSGKISSAVNRLLSSTNQPPPTSPTTPTTMASTSLASSSTESPVSIKTSKGLEIVKKIKTQLFPLCASDVSQGALGENSSPDVSPQKDEVKIETTEEAMQVDEVKEPENDRSFNSPREKVIIMDSIPDSHKYKLSIHQPQKPKHFINRVRQEMEILRSSLPESIIVKAFEDRMDLLSFLIKGPENTPYEDGLFVFDVQLPANYPAVPPSVHYISYCRDRLNPNLYENGKVCVSLLGTWFGKSASESWIPGSSNLLQVIISIQGLILVPEPYFNEAGYQRQKGTEEGQENSRLYNEMAVVKVVQSMTKMLSCPHEAFKDEIFQHMKEKGTSLVRRLKEWIDISEQFEKQPDPAEKEKLVTSTNFPLLPASQGFCLSLKRALSSFETILSTLSS